MGKGVICDLLCFVLCAFKRENDSHSHILNKISSPRSLLASTTFYAFVQLSNNYPKFITLAPRGFAPFSR